MSRRRIRKADEHLKSQHENDGRGGDGDHEVGLEQDEIARRGWAVNARERDEAGRKPDVIFIELREGRSATAPGSSGR